MPVASGRILLIDDDPGTRETLRDILGLRGLHVETAARGAQALEILRGELFEAAVVDIRLPDISGLDLLRAIKASSPHTEVIFITGHASVATAVQAIDNAAFGYLVKPLNLLVNAHQAVRQVPEPRRLSLTTRFDPVTGRVSVEVADTGPGVLPSIEARLFEPFFTTKPPGQGTGLGLSLCRGVVESHGGSITFERREPRGAVFRVELPVSMPTAGAAPDAPDGPAALRGLRVLAVDDEPDILDILADLLAKDGHRVDRATDGQMALDRLRGATYDLIVSDVRMPEMDGPALYRELEQHMGAMTSRFIFVTGDALTPETQEFVRRTGVPTVGKPFNADEIGKVVQRTVAAAGGRNG